MIALLLGTSAARCRHSYEPEYSVGFYNDTPAQITDLRADWTAGGTPRYEFRGIMNPEAEALFHEEPRPIPNTAIVNWISADGMKHRQAVEVAKQIADPAQFSGTIYFKVRSDGDVVVAPITYSEQKRLAAGQKRFP